MAQVYCDYCGIETTTKEAIVNDFVGIECIDCNMSSSISR